MNFVWKHKFIFLWATSLCGGILVKVVQNNDLYFLAGVIMSCIFLAAELLLWELKESKK